MSKDGLRVSTKIAATQLLRSLTPLEMVSWSFILFALLLFHLFLNALDYPYGVSDTGGPLTIDDSSVCLDKYKHKRDICDVYMMWRAPETLVVTLYSYIQSCRDIILWRHPLRGAPPKHTFPLVEAKHIVIFTFRCSKRHAWECLICSYVDVCRAPHDTLKQR